MHLRHSFDFLCRLFVFQFLLKQKHVLTVDIWELKDPLHVPTAIQEEDAAASVQKQNAAANKNGANSPDKKQTVKLVKSVIYLSHEWVSWSAETAALILSS